MKDEKVAVGLVLGFLTIVGGVIAGYSYVKAQDKVKYERSLRKNNVSHGSSLGTRK